MSGLGTSAAAIEISSDIRTALEQATTVVEIQEVMREAALNQGLVERDAINPSVLIPTERATQAPVHKVVVISGTEYELSGADEAELAASELKLYRDLGATEQSAQQVEPHGRGTDGRFVAADDAAAQVDFQGWKAATDAFKARHPEWEELAGEENTRIMGTILSENNLLDEADKLSAMEKSYRHGIEHGLFHETPQGRTVRLIGEAQTPEDLRAALGRSPYAN